MNLIFLTTTRDLYQGRDLYLYRDFYCYIPSQSDFYQTISNEWIDRFIQELSGRIHICERLEKENLFQGIDLQKIQVRFKEQQAFIMAKREGKNATAPEKSIFETWLEVWNLPHELLENPQEFVQQLTQYVQHVNQMLKFKEATNNVSPEVWAAIEGRLFDLVE